jgi:hypothetical protein
MAKKPNSLCSGCRMTKNRWIRARTVSDQGSAGNGIRGIDKVPEAQKMPVGIYFAVGCESAGVRKTPGL